MQTTQPRYAISADDLADHILHSGLSTDYGGYVAVLEIRDSRISRHLASPQSYYPPGHGPDASAAIPEVDGINPNPGNSLADFARANILPDELADLTRGDIPYNAREVAAIILDGLHATDTSVSLLRRDMTDDGDLVEAEIEVDVNVEQVRQLVTDALALAAREWIGRHPDSWGVDSLEGLLVLMRAADSWDALTDLPTFGGSDAHGGGVWSWDATRLLIGTCSDDVRIIGRDEVA